MTSLAYAEPADRQALKARLADADISVLLMVLVQLTGDTSLLDRLSPHLGKPGTFTHALTPAMVEEVLDRLATALEQGVEPQIDTATLRRMMSSFVGEPISDRYLPMLLQDLGFAAAPAPFAKANAKTRSRRDRFKVLIVGAGASGICAGIMLKRAGIAFEIIERNDDVGGVWHENTYPGCGVDSANHLYCYSFALNHAWSRYYVKQPELRDYLRDCARDYGLTPHITLGREVVSLRYDEATCLWHSTVREPNGTVSERIVNAVISSVGQLNRPAIPAIAGLESFAGPTMHTARWRDDVVLKGKSVAMIGTGASGMQVGPAIADDVARLTIYQRSAPWVLPRHNYHNTVTDNVKWVLANVPHYAQWYRFLLFWAYGDGVHPALMREEGWDRQDSISARNAEIRELWTQYVKQEVGDLPDLYAKVLPDYPPYGKRSLRDNDWYSTLRRPHVALANTGIDRIVPDGIVDRTGVHHPTDVIIFATGFEASRMLYPMQVIGRDGSDLRALWGDDDPRAYLGITVPKFPNLFLTYGPNTNLAHGGSIIFQAECQVHYIVQSLELLLASDADALEVTQDAHDAYNEELDQVLAKMVWSHEGTTNWYKNAKGRITTNSPWPLVEYWHRTREPDPKALTLFKSAAKTAPGDHT